MYSFILPRKPKSYNTLNTTKRRDYTQALQNALTRYHGTINPLKGNLYGLVYHFFHKDSGLDADNLSKPVWDCLKSILFDDDKQIKWRTAGSFYLQSHDITLIDFSGIPSLIITDLLEAIETEDHILYVECGRFDISMVKINLEVL
ncbi:RusA family crossover junction endodeoxyribonuclease [Larkinella soli]|uniref:RusA family crossover junction endodeoxyribonuclease n=1 Tax=Larkinella soli TaxID=1770527 RepID=UPI0013E40241|nr:RusA family crossover junction endodeoxyribonuclease [Larkinella soli]